MARPISHQSNGPTNARTRRRVVQAHLLASPANPCVSRYFFYSTFGRKQCVLLEAYRGQIRNPSNHHRVVQRHPPAINHHNFTRDVAGRITRQISHGIGNLRRLAEPLHRGAAHDFGFRFFARQHGFGGEFCGDGAGRCDWPHSGSYRVRLEADLKFLSHRPKNGSQVVHAWITCR